MITMVGEGSSSSDFMTIFTCVLHSSLPKTMSFVSFCFYFSILCPTTLCVGLEKIVLLPLFSFFGSFSY